MSLVLLIISYSKASYMIKNPIKSYFDLYRQEAYVYFDQNVRRLPIDASGQFDEPRGETRNQIPAQIL